MAGIKVRHLVAGEFNLAFVDGPGPFFVTPFIPSSDCWLPLRLFGLAALLGVWRSATAGIALSLGLAFLEGIVGGLMALAGGWVGSIPQYMIDTNGDTLALSDGGVLSDLYRSSGFSETVERPSVQHAVIVLLCWAFTFIAASYSALFRQDLPYER